MSKVNKTMVSITLVAVIVLVTFGISYSYFTTDNTSGSTSTIIVEGGKMTLAYSNGASIGFTNIYPSNEEIGHKMFSITGTNNTGIGQMKYHLSFVTTINEFENGDIKCLLGGKETTTGSLSEKIYNETTNPNKMDINKVPENTNPWTLDLGTGYFGANADGSVHEYGLYFYYPETGQPQNGQGLKFAGYILIEPVK